MGMEGGRALGGKAETRRHKSNLRGLRIPLAYFLSSVSSGVGGGGLAKRLGDILFSHSG